MSTTEYYQREVSDSEDEFTVQRSRKTSNRVFPDSEDEQVSKSKKSKTAKKTASKKRKPAEEELTDTEDEQLNKRKKSTTAKKNASKKRKPAEEELTDSEDEQLNKRASKAGKKRPATNKQKRSTSVEKRAPTSGWKLELDDDEEIESCRAPPARLQSVLTRRIADGNLRRTASLPGDLFIDLRVYNTKDIRSVAPKDRWEKSLLSLKYQTDSDADGVDQLRQFIKLARADFVEEGTFFADKKK